MRKGCCGVRYRRRPLKGSSWSCTHSPRVTALCRSPNLNRPLVSPRRAGGPAHHPGRGSGGFSQVPPASLRRTTTASFPGSA